MFKFSGMAGSLLRFWRYLFGVCGIIGMILAGNKLVDIFEHSPLFAILEIEQEGSHRLKLEEICNLSGVRAGSNLLALDTAQVSARLERHPWIRSASVVKHFPGRLEFKIREREPLAVLKIRRELYYLDAEGIIFHRLEVGDRLDYPVITGVDDYSGDARQLIGIRRIRKALALLHVLKGSVVLGTLSEIHTDPEEGLKFYLEKLPVPILIGWEQYLQKRRQLESIFSELAVHMAELEAIDLRFKRQVVLRKL